MNEHDVVDFWRPNRFDVYGLTAFLTVTVWIAVYLWPWHVLIGILGAILLIGVIGLRVYMMLEHHWADIAAKRNRGLVVHETEHGFGYVEDGSTNKTIKGYSHALSGNLPMLEGGVSTGADRPVSTKFGYAEHPRTFGELVQGGYVFPGADFVLGFDESTGEPIKLPAITSIGIGGGQGFGKTNTTELLMLESVAKYNGRVRFLEIDPHINADTTDKLYAKTRALEPFFLTASNAGDLPNPIGLYGYEDVIAAWLRVWAEEFERRLTGGSGPMWVLVIDEGASVFSSSVGVSVSTLIENINGQARKVDMFVIIASREWKASRLNGTEMRDTIVSFVLHNTPESVAELVVPSDVARQTLRLSVGEVVLFTGGHDYRGQVPYVSERDARLLVEQYEPRTVVKVKEVKDARIDENYLLGGQGTISIMPPERSQGKTQELVVQNNNGSIGLPVGISAEEIEQVRGLYLEGLDISTIAWRMYGGPKRSREYDKEVAQAKVREVLKWLVGSRGGSNG